MAYDTVRLARLATSFAAEALKAAQGRHPYRFGDPNRARMFAARAAQLGMKARPELRTAHECTAPCNLVAVQEGDGCPKHTCDGCRAVVPQCHLRPVAWDAECHVCSNEVCAVCGVAPRPEGELGLYGDPRGEA